MKKNKDLGLLKKSTETRKVKGWLLVKLFWESWELFSARHEHSISVPDSTSLNHCASKLVILELHSNRSGTDPQDAGISLNQVTFKTRFDNWMSRIGCGYRRGHGML